MTNLEKQFKVLHPEGGILLNTIPVSDDAIVVTAQVYTNFPNGLVGSAQQLVTDPSEFSNAEIAAIEQALTRTGFLEGTNTPVEVSEEISEPAHDEATDVTTEEETNEEEEVATNTDTAATASDNTNPLKKYKHMLSSKTKK